MKYEATLESLNGHPLPAWYAGAKLGFLVCWGPYSVPGWAPLSHPEHDFDSLDYIKNDPYAEWYYNVMRIEGSATQAYHASITERTSTTTILFPFSIAKHKSGTRRRGPRSSGNREHDTCC